MGAATDPREAALGFRTTHRYRSALNGFSAKLTDGQVNALQSDPAVDFVQADRVVHATDSSRGLRGANAADRHPPDRCRQGQPRCARRRRTTSR